MKTSEELVNQFKETYKEYLMEMISEIMGVESCHQHDSISEVKEEKEERLRALEIEIKSRIRYR